MSATHSTRLFPDLALRRRLIARLARLGPIAAPAHSREGEYAAHPFLPPARPDGRANLALDPGARPGGIV